MVAKSTIDAFLKENNLAIVGVSKNRRKFGNIVYRDLSSKGYGVFAVNPTAREIEGNPCYPDLASLPEPVGGAVLVVPPKVTERVVREAHTAGITRIWMQQGSESDQAIRYCEDHDIEVVHGMCVMMFSEPVGSLHKFHRWLWKLLGKLPK
jgi:predicted CoA-binding protein